MMIAVVAIAPPSHLHPHSRDQEDYSLNYLFGKFTFFSFFFSPASFNRVCVVCPQSGSGTVLPGMQGAASEMRSGPRMTESLTE